MTTGLTVLQAPAAPPAKAAMLGTAATLMAPTTMHADGAELEWTKYGLAAGETFTKYEIHRSTTAAFTPSATTLLSTVSDIEATTYRDTSAKPGIAFSYRIVANGVISNEQRVTLPAQDRTVKLLQPAGDRGQASFMVHNVTAPPACSDDWNYGSAANLRIGPASNGWIHRPVLRFDLRDIPAKSTLVSATMTLSYNATAAAGGAINVHRLLQPWEEGNGTGQCNGSGVSWNETERGVKWKTGGAAFDATYDYQLPNKARTTAGTDAYAVTGLVQKWVNGTPNHGLLLKFAADTPSTTSPWFDYLSDDTTTASSRPKLRVEYTDYSKPTAPRIDLVDPAAGSTVRGAVTVTAAAGDDRRVDRVEFFIDGGTTPVATDTSAPWQGTWNTAGLVNGSSHTITAKATDDVGQQTTTAARTVTVDNSAPPNAVSLTSPPSGASVTGTITLNASASDDLGVSLVEFLVDDHVVGTATTSPYSTTWNTLDPLLTAYDGSHEIKVRAYDRAGQATTSGIVTVTTTNTSSTMYQASFDLNQMGPSDDPFAIPPLNRSNELATPIDAYSGSTSLRDLGSTPYDSSAEYSGPVYSASESATGGDEADLVLIPPPDDPKSAYAFQCEVTVTNDSSVAWKGDDLQLWYRWYTLDGTILFEGIGNDYFPQTVQPGQSKRIPITVEPPALPQGIDLSQVRLRFDVYNYAETGTNKWFAGHGNPPSDNPVIVDKDLEGALGLEKFWQYEGDDVGAGMATLTNVANGNMLLRWSPFFAPGRGLATMVDLTYNSLEDHSRSPAGNNMSLSLSGLSRFGEPIDIHPNNADTISGKSNKYVVVTDGDGTTHKFTGVTNADGTTTWTEPPGVNLYLRTTTDPDANRRWALTRPDNVTFYFDPDGFPTAVVDRNGNTLTFTLEDTPGGEDPGGPKKRVTRVTDAAGRAFTIDYYSKDEAKKAHVRGNIQRISDHSGSALDFEYYDDGNLRKLIQRGGTKANGDPLAARSFVFTYTTSNGTGPAIADPALRVDPEPKTPNQSTRIYSVRDPRGAETRYAYYGPSEGAQLRWKLKNRTNRNGNVTNFSYNITTRTTTVDAPLSRDTDYVYDTTGKVTSIVNPLEQTIGLQWTSDFQVSKVTEPTGRFISYTYNHNGYLASETDQLGNKTELTYLNRQLDSRDALGHWSLLQTRTTPRGTKTATAGDFQWTFTYDTPGNVDLVTDPDDYVSNYDWNLAGSANAGTVSKVTDPNGGVTTFDYDPSGQPSRITDPLGRITQFGYDVDGQQIWLQDPNHATDSGTDVRAYRTYFDYDAFHRLGRQSAPKSTKFDRGRLVWSGADFDANDNVVLQRDPHFGSVAEDGQDGPTRTARYDAMDQLTEQANPDKTVDSLGERTLYAWDAAERLVKTTKPKGALSTTVTDDYASEYSYDVLDRITRQADYGTSTTEARYVHMCYDVAGDLRSVTSPRAGLTSLTCPGDAPATVSFTTTYEYDPAHRLVKQRDPLNHETRRTYDENDNVTSVERDIDTAVDPDRITRTEISYNERDLPDRSEELFDQSTGRKLVTLIEYDGNRNRVRQITPRAYDEAGGSGTYTNYVTKYVFDKADQLVRTDLPFDGRDNGERQYEHRSYDANGRLVWNSLPVTTTDSGQVQDTARNQMTYWDPGWVRTSDKPADPKVSYDYAAQGWQIRRTPDKKGQPGVPDLEREMLWSFFDDGMLKERRDRDGNPSTYTYDADNRLTKALDASGVHGADDSPMQTEASYTGFDEVAKSRHKRETATTWTFTKYRYDPNGNVDRRFENGKETGTDINTATQTAPPREHQLSYDEADWLTQQLDLGTDGACKDDQRIVNSFWGTGWERQREVFRGDASCTADSGTWKRRQVTNWDHFNNGKLKTLTTTAYKSDGSSEVTEKHDVGYFEGSRYENGHRTTDSFILKRGDSGTTCVGPTPCDADYDYDAREKLIKHQKRAGSVATYTLDEPSKLIGDTSVRAGNVTTESADGSTTTRRYEGNQLKELSAGGSTASYVYDNFGNVDCVTAGAGGTSCPNGGTSLIADYAYDNLDRMVSQKTYATAGTATDTADYTYDALDRISKEVETHEGTTDDRTTDFTYQGLSNLVTEEKQSGGSNPKTKSFSYDAYGHRIAMQDKTNATGVTETFTYATDVHGSVSQLISEAGTVKASYGYSAYGSRDNSLSTGDLNDKAPLNPYRFQNKRLDSGSATTAKPASSVDMGARRFGVDTGRFLQQDMFANALGDLALNLDPLTQNTYALAGGNPVSFVEVDGHMVIADGGGGGSTSPNPTRPTPAPTPGPSPSPSAPNDGRNWDLPKPDKSWWEKAANVSDYVAGPLMAAPQAVGEFGSYAGKYMHSNWKWLASKAGSFNSSLSHHPKLRDLGRWARGDVAGRLGKGLGIVGAGISFMKHRSEGDKVLAAGAKTGVEFAGAWAGAKAGAAIGAAIGSALPGAGTAAGALIGGAVGALAGAFTAGEIMDSGVGEKLESGMDAAQDWAGDKIGDVGDAIGGLFD
ncbi:MAG TPA: Ig-like domain-containing protein [Micromonosporaceae bacterium]